MTVLMSNGEVQVQVGITQSPSADTMGVSLQILFRQSTENALRPEQRYTPRFAIGIVRIGVTQLHTQDPGLGVTPQPICCRHVTV